MSRQRLQTSTGEAVWHTKKDPPKAPLLPCAIFGLSGFVRWAPLWASHEGERTSSDAQLAKPTTATPKKPRPRTGERRSAKAPRCRHSLARCQVEEAFAEAVFKLGVVAEATVAGGTFMSVGLADEGFCDCVLAMHVTERSARDKAPKRNAARTSTPPLIRSNLCRSSFLCDLLGLPARVLGIPPRRGGVSRSWQPVTSPPSRDAPNSMHFDEVVYE